MFTFFALFFGLVSIFVAFKGHDRFDPARYFLLMCGGQVLLVYVLFHSIFAITGNGMAFIAMMGLVFSIGTWLGQWLGQYARTHKTERVFHNNRSLVLLQLCMAFAMINVLYGIQAIGYSVKDILSFKALVALNVAASDARYLTNVPTTLTSQVSLIFVYLAPLYGGYLAPFLKGKKRVWSFLSVLPAMLIAMTQAMKLNFVTGIVLWVVGVIVSSYANNPDFLRIKPATVFKIAGSALFVFAVLFLSMMFKAGTFDADTTTYMLQRFVEYAFGQFAVFDSWFTHHMGEVQLSGGIKTFFGVSNYLGLAQRQQGVFTEFVNFGINTNHQIPWDLNSNIYTAFRFLLEDFGFIGSFIAVCVSGVVSGFTWLMVKREPGNLLFQTVLVALLFFVFMSFATSVWVYTSFIATVVLFFGIVSLSFSKQSNSMPVCQAVSSSR